MNATKPQRDCPQPPACGLQPATSAVGPPGSTADRSVHAFLKHPPPRKNRGVQGVSILPAFSPWFVAPIRADRSQFDASLSCALLVKFERIAWRRRSCKSDLTLGSS